MVEQIMQDLEMIINQSPRLYLSVAKQNDDITWCAVQIQNGKLRRVIESTGNKNNLKTSRDKLHQLQGIAQESMLYTYLGNLGFIEMDKLALMFGLPLLPQKTKFIHAVVYDMARRRLPTQPCSYDMLLHTLKLDGGKSVQSGTLESTQQLIRVTEALENLPILCNFDYAAFENAETIDLQLLSQLYNINRTVFFGVLQNELKRNEEGKAKVTSTHNRFKIETNLNSTKFHTYLFNFIASRTSEICEAKANALDCINPEETPQGALIFSPQNVVIDWNIDFKWD